MLFPDIMTDTSVCLTHYCQMKPSTLLWSHPDRYQSMPDPSMSDEVFCHALQTNQSPYFTQHCQMRLSALLSRQVSVCAWSIRVKWILLPYFADKSQSMLDSLLSNEAFCLVFQTDPFLILVFSGFISFSFFPQKVLYLMRPVKALIRHCIQQHLIWM